MTDLITAAEEMLRQLPEPRYVSPYVRAQRDRWQAAIDDAKAQACAPFAVFNLPPPDLEPIIEEPR